MKIRPAALIVLTLSAVLAGQQSQQANGGSSVLRGSAAMGDWTTDKPGVRRLITVNDLPGPFASESVDNGPELIPRPQGASPQALAGFTVEQIASGLTNPRVVVAAPNGDLFVAESQANRIRVLRGLNAERKAETVHIFATGLRQPFGIAFYPRGPNPNYVYIANTDSVVRFPYKNGDLEASGKAEVIVPDLPGGGRLRGGGHWTRDIVFSKNGKKMYVSVGSHSNNDDDKAEFHRADVLEYNPDGGGFRIYASGLRNAVGIAINPQTGELWGSVNERDGLGDNLPPDYVTRIKDGGFYGWPWYYIGGHQDPAHKGEHPELRNKVTVPDVLLQAHSASLAMTFYTGDQFPREYQGDAFAAEHGSWNRSKRTGYKIIRILLKDGKPTGEYEDFVIGFVSPSGVWGRPVGVTVAKDGALIFTDDASDSVWRVSYTGAKGVGSK